MWGLGVSSGVTSMPGAGSSFGGGDWVINLSGSGTSNQSASAATGSLPNIPQWAIVLGVVGVAWLLLKR